MLDIKKIYKWNEVVSIDKSDKDFFLKFFYNTDIPVEIIDNNIYTTYPYEELVIDLVKAHYEGVLSDEYYDNRIDVEIFKTENIKRESNFNIFKIILPIILIMILLMFIRFLLLEGIL